MIDGFTGVTAIDTRLLVTDNVLTGLVTPASAAVMFVLPTAALVARPVPAIVAVPVLLLAHATEFVMSAVELS